MMHCIFRPSYTAAARHRSAGVFPLDSVSFSTAHNPPFILASSLPVLTATFGYVASSPWLRFPSNATTSFAIATTRRRATSLCFLSVAKLSFSSPRYLFLGTANFCPDQSPCQCQRDADLASNALRPIRTVFVAL